LELLLELGWDRGHRGSTSLEGLLLLRLLLLLLAWEPSELLLERLLRLQSLALHWKAGILLLQRSLSEACGLRRKGTGLLARLLASAHVTKRSSAILLLLAARSLAVTAQKGVRVGVHCG
jgi:hypothetical protein